MCHLPQLFVSRVKMILAAPPQENVVMARDDRFFQNWHVSRGKRSSKPVALRISIWRVRSRRHIWKSKVGQIVVLLIVFRTGIRRETALNLTKLELAPLVMAVLSELLRLSFKSLATSWGLLQSLDTGSIFTRSSGVRRLGVHW